MTSRHFLDNERFTIRGDGLVIMHAWCGCTLLFVTTGRTLKRARRSCRRTVRDHQGSAAAAGPGAEAA